MLARARVYGQKATNVIWPECLRFTVKSCSELPAAHDYLYFFGLDHTPSRLALADAALKAVVRLRPDAGETHLARANFFYRCYLDYDHARRELALAQHALPNNSEIFEVTGYIDRRQGL